MDARQDFAGRLPLSARVLDRSQSKLTKRIAIFIPSMRGGGAEHVAALLANGLSKRGFSTDLVLVQAAGPNLAKVTSGVRIVDLSSKRTSLSLIPLVRYLRKERPDAMFAFMEHANAIAGIAKDLSGVAVRFVPTVRGTRAPGSATGAWQRVSELIANRTYKNAYNVLANSAVAARDIERQSRLRRPLSVVGNPIDVAEVEAKAKAFSPPLPSGPVIVAAGRLVVEKDYPTMLRAFAQVKERRPASLVILGEGPERENLNRTAADLGITDDVSFLGYQPNPYPYMAASDAFVMSSRNEGFPNALIEALALNASVVATDCPGAPSDILDAGKWGRLVPVGDHDSMAKAIEQAIDAPIQGGSARAREFSVDRAVDAYLETAGIDPRP